MNNEGIKKAMAKPAVALQSSRQRVIDVEPEIITADEWNQKLGSYSDSLNTQLQTPQDFDFMNYDSSNQFSFAIPGSTVKNLEQAMKEFSKTQEIFGKLARAHDSKTIALWQRMKKRLRKRFSGRAEREYTLREIYETQVNNLDNIFNYLGLMATEASPFLDEVRTALDEILVESEQISRILEKARLPMEKGHRRYQELTQRVKQCKKNSPEYFVSLRQLITFENPLVDREKEISLYETRQQYNETQIPHAWACKRILEQSIGFTDKVAVSVHSIRSNSFRTSKRKPTCFRKSKRSRSNC